MEYLTQLPIKWDTALNIQQHTQTLNLNSSDFFLAIKGATKLEKEFECRKCAKTVSAEQHKISPFCPTCGTLLNVKPQPKHWLFQFNPSVYKWFDRIKDTKEPEQWLISQHVQLIHKDDLVAIWGSGQKAGIYALGKIITNPKKNPLNLN
jgi:DNA-directed RNA polymerase subunit RPC12/RpoP